MVAGGGGGGRRCTVKTTEIKYIAPVDFSPTLKVPWLEEADLVLAEVELVEVLEGGDGVTGELVQVITTHVQAQQIPAQHIFFSALLFK